MPKLNFFYKPITAASFIFFILTFFGCGESLRTLQALGSEQQSQQNLIRAQKARFEVLLKDIKRSRLKPGLSRTYLISKYGPPVLSRDVKYASGEDDVRVRLLYRDPVNYIDSMKVYLEFDENDKLINFRLQQGSPQ